MVVAQLRGQLTETGLGQALEDVRKAFGWAGPASYLEVLHADPGEVARRLSLPADPARADG